MEISKETQEKVYNFLKENYYGKENGDYAVIVSDNYFDTFENSELNARQFRRICKAINQNPDLGFISTSGSIYACKTQEEVEKAIKNTWRTAITYIKKAQSMSKKFGQQGQYEFTDDGQKIKILFEEC